MMICSPSSVKLPMCAHAPRFREVLPASGEKGVSDGVSPHDRIGWTVGAQADECYGDVRREGRGPGAATDWPVGVLIGYVVVLPA